MDSQMPRRYACDRCREQKLRCPRNQQGDKTCDRCRRVGALCVTSSGRPLGRPRLNANHGAHSQGSATKSSSHGQEAHTSSSRRDINFSRGSNLPPSPLSFKEPTAKRAGTATATTNTSSSVESDFEAIFYSQLNDIEVSPSGGHKPSPSESQDWFCSESAIMPELEFENQRDSTNQLIEDLQNPMSGSDYNAPAMGETLPSNVFGNSDEMAPLIGVMGTISRQLSELKNHSWDPSFMRISMFDGNEQDSGGAARLNPLDNIMHISMKFVLVLQTMAPAECSKTSPLHSPPPLSLLLMLISTHLQLGQLFDAILTRVNVCLQDGPMHSDSSFPTQCNQRGGFSAHSGRLQITMMILFIEHHLSSVERLMGLPAEFRLWNHRGECTGILDPESNTLIEAVMGQAQEIFVSLKQTMERIQVSLRS